MSAWDVIVAGGGPGGSTAAWRLARAGKKVLVLDAQKFPRVKLCAGWVTRRVMADLELDPSSYPHTLQPFEAVYVSCGGALQETRWKEPASYGIIRKEFDTFLLRRAEAAGAEVREGVRVKSLEEGREGVRVRADQAYEAKAVVGAGGHTCPVARKFGGVRASESVVLTQESETRVGEEVLRRTAPHYGLPELFAEPDFRGYAWYFTKGDFLNIGVGCIGRRPGVHERLEALMVMLCQSGRVPADLKFTPFKGHAYSVRRRAVRRVAGERFLLVGDSAGLARDVSGEGIGPAVRSAAVAAEVLAEWLDGRGELSDYARRIEGLYGSGERGLTSWLASLLPEGVIRAVAKGICGNAWLRRKVVLEGAFGIG